jgi:hypothetical protein
VKTKAVSYSCCQLATALRLGRAVLWREVSGKDREKGVQLLADAACGRSFQYKASLLGVDTAELGFSCKGVLQGIHQCLCALCLCTSRLEVARYQRCTTCTVLEYITTVAVWRRLRKLQDSGKNGQRRITNISNSTKQMHFSMQNYYLCLCADSFASLFAHIPWLFLVLRRRGPTRAWFRRRGRMTKKPEDFAHRASAVVDDITCPAAVDFV